jgi:pimeloyl-ACP methyl ester carboxylesterase
MSIKSSGRGEFTLSVYTTEVIESGKSMKKYVTIQGGNNLLNISYVFRKAKERSIVLIHGLGSGADCFEDIWDFPGYQDFTILAFDLPGFGDSDKPEWFDYSMESQAKVCNLIIRRFDLKNINLVAHSMGGAIGLLAIPATLSCMQSFICLEGNLIREDCYGSRMALSYSFDDFRVGGFQSLKNDISLHADDNYKNCLAKCPDYAFYKSSESLVKWSDSGKLLEAFLRLEINKAYVYGEYNEDAPVLKRLSGLNILKVSGSGHGMMADNPHEFYSGLLGLLR